MSLLRLNIAGPQAPAASNRLLNSRLMVQLPPITAPQKTLKDLKKGP